MKKLLFIICLISTEAKAITEQIATADTFSKPIATEIKVINSEELPDIYFKIQLASCEERNLRFLNLIIKEKLKW